MRTMRTDRDHVVVLDMIAGVRSVGMNAVYDVDVLPVFGSTWMRVATLLPDDDDLTDQRDAHSRAKADALVAEIESAISVIERL
jgi:hypothetical protein